LVSNAGFSPARARSFARFAVVIVFAWFGVMNFTSVGAAMVERWLTGHFLLGILGADQLAYVAPWVAKLLGVAQISGALLIALPSPRLQSAGAGLLSVLALGAMSLLITNPVWINGWGGFPAIGAGQGLIKYVAILGLLFYLGTEGQRRFLNTDSARFKALASPLILFGLILVLGWIGAMKFTEVEAKGIEPLLQSSPLFFWMGKLFALQTSSILIGVAELMTAGLLLAGWYNKSLFTVGALMTVATLATTLSFMFTLPGWSEPLGGFPALSSSGHFLLKDLLLLAGCLVLVSER
jgi:uncharacterized membrane protein YkgB